MQERQSNGLLHQHSKKVGRVAAKVNNGQGPRIQIQIQTPNQNQSQSQNFEGHQAGLKMARYEIRNTEYIS